MSEKTEAQRSRWNDHVALICLLKKYMRVIYELSPLSILVFFLLNSPGNCLSGQMQWISTVIFPNAVHLLSSITSHHISSIRTYVSNELPGSVPSHGGLLILTGLHGLLNLGTMLPFLDEVLQGRLAQQRSRDLVSVQAKRKKMVDSKFNYSDQVRNRMSLLVMQSSLPHKIFFYIEKKLYFEKKSLFKTNHTKHT